eukprot:TRINITY_DN416_c0_g1_i1.p2 TRINITY_DN416_c0_g1~~TRINITY_DN416_c0_g1_i1.p2  ORF type:complete len:197 (-),score=31.59 TRINITY_DN416_c0_g1_i1:191-781(-)
MPKTWVREEEINHPWERVSAAVWRKYPHPRAPHVKAVDIVNRHVDHATGILRSTRFVQCLADSIPGILKPILKATALFDFSEESEVDIKAKKHCMTATNVSLNNLLDVRESCEYVAHPDDPNKTIFRQEVQVKGFLYGFREALESQTVQRYTSNAEKGLSLLLSICDDLKQGTTGVMFAASPDESTGAGDKIPARE